MLLCADNLHLVVIHGYLRYYSHKVAYYAPLGALEKECGYATASEMQFTMLSHLWFYKTYSFAKAVMHRCMLHLLLLYKHNTSVVLGLDKTCMSYLE